MAHVPGSAGTPLGNSGEVPKERLAGTPQDEVILQLENELVELRNACAWKDQRIAELSRTDTSAVRLKRDIRLLATELHQTRKQLSESLGELQELQAQLGRGEAGAAAVSVSRDVLDSPSSSGVGRSNANGDRGVQLRERVAELQEENRQLREAVAQLKNLETMHHSRQPSGASTQRSSEPQQPHPGTGNYRSSDPGMPRAPYLSGPAPGQQGSGGSGLAPQVATPPQEELLRQIVYSTVHTENTATIGPTTLQGVGTVDGVASVAKVLLQRIHSSVCAQHRRPVAAGMPQPGQPMQPGQMPMVVVGMPGM